MAPVGPAGIAGTAWPDARLASMTAQAETGISSCSALSAALGEPLAGTAPVAPGWLLIEQPGAWGHKAVTQSDFDPAIGAELERRGSAAGVRIGLIRRPGRNAHGAARTAYAASTRPGASWVRRVDFTHGRDLLDLDLADLSGAGRPAGSDPMLLVCTNAKRDTCCAVLGRALASELDAAGLDLWESSHLGGHRFAPTGVLLPTGYAYGRWDAAAARAAVEAAAAGAMTADRCRGRSAYDRPGQIAELAVREAIGETGADAIVVDDAAAGDRRVVRHLDGRRWEVTLAPMALGPATADPCAGKTIEPRALTVEAVTALA